MSEYLETTKARHQWTEALIFISILTVGIIGYTIYSRLANDELAAKAAEFPRCAWNTTIAATVPNSTQPNYLINASAEISAEHDAPLNWQSNSWGENKADFIYLADGASDGSRSLKVVLSDFKTGDAKWVNASLTSALSEQAYLFKTDYKSDVETSVIAEITFSNSQKQYIDLGKAPASNEWRKLERTFITPKHTAQVNAYQIIYNQGYLQTDNYYLAPYQPTALNEGIVSLTFDDGARPIHKYGLPLLNKYSMPSTQYLVTDPISQSNNTYYVRPSEVQDFIKSGHEIGSHTAHHKNLSESTNQDVQTEIQQPQTDFMALLGHKANNFATPFGAYDEYVIQEAKKHYCSHRSTDAGFNSPDYFDLYNIRVQNVKIDTPISTIEDWVNFAQKNKVWLVLVFHEIEDNGGEYSYSPQNLENVLRYLSNSKIQVNTVADAILIMQKAQIHQGIVTNNSK